MRYYFFFFFCFLTFLGCQTTPSPPKQYRMDGYVRYDDLAGELYGEAAFKALQPVGSATPSVIAGGVLFQGRKMNLAGEQNLLYRAKLTGRADSCAFTWRDSLTGAGRRLAVALPRIDSFWFAQPTLNTRQPAQLRWTGGDLKRGETLVLLWEKGGQTVKTEVYNQSGIAFLDLPAAKMGELEAGAWTLYLVRKQLTKPVVGGVESACIAEFYTKPVRITVR
jgi:hypothetical protein